MPFGITTAPKSLPERLNTSNSRHNRNSHNCRWYFNFSNWKRATGEEAIPDHDRSLLKLLNRCTEREVWNWTARNANENYEHPQSHTRECAWLYAKGLQPHQTKIETVTGMEPWQDSRSDAIHWNDHMSFKAHGTASVETDDTTGDWTVIVCSPWKGISEGQRSSNCNASAAVLWLSRRRDCTLWHITDGSWCKIEKEVLFGLERMREGICKNTSQKTQSLERFGCILYTL